MAISMSDLLTHIKIDLGIYGLVLPFDNADEEIVKVIKNRTLTTFSRYLPDVTKITLTLSDLTCIKNLYQESVYVLPDLFGTREIHSIRKVYPQSMLISGGYYAPYIESTPEMYTAMMLTQANSDLMSSISPPFTFKFQSPNLLYLYNISTMYGMIEVEFNVYHAENLSTVRSSTYDSFYELAILDIKNFLYGALKHFKNIQTAYGTITLEIDDWSSAATDRKDLIERWRDVYHMETEQFYII